MAHKIEYSMVVVFNDEAITATVTGESVKIDKAENAILRPKHVRLFADIHHLMREYIKNN